MIYFCWFISSTLHLELPLSEATTTTLFQLLLTPITVLSLPRAISPLLCSRCPSLRWVLPPRQERPAPSGLQCPKHLLLLHPQPNTHPVVSTGVQPTIPHDLFGWPRVPRSPRWGRLRGRGELVPVALAGVREGVWVSVWRLGGREAAGGGEESLGTDGNATPYSQGMPLLKSTALMCRVSASHR